jgi:sulfite reductase (NADPH) flavoprotein alpha-component
MLASPKLKVWEELITGSSKEELAWMSGYLSGILSANGTLTLPQPSAVPAPPTPSISRLTVVYGTESGNSKRLAQEFAGRLKKKGLPARVVSLDQYRLADLSKEQYLVVVLSTQGEGEPPQAAKKFYDHLHQASLSLPELHYGVLALGDSSYPLFCKAGEDVDGQLHRLGAQRLLEVQKCDTDFEGDAHTWYEQLEQRLLAQAAPAAAAVATAAVAAPKKPSGKTIYRGRIAANITLNDWGSKKETHHLEVLCDGVQYLPGDALGVIPENPQGVVAVCLSLLGADKAHRVSFRSEELPLEDLLKTRVNINFLPQRVVKKYAALVQADIPLSRMALMELLRLYPLQDGQLQSLIDLLEPLAPRLYSISSSPQAHPGEVHVTVARDLFLINEEIQCGLCSDYLSHLQQGEEVEFYIHKNNLFRLPAEDKDVIMIGPGTGIAPFRSFLAHREAQGAGGRNWLFFGDQHFVSDFLYQSELQSWMQTGVLTRLNVAFSRDQQEKVYVQHKMLRHAQELYGWIEGGASLYVCGAKEPMSVDVEDTLLQIIGQQGRKSIEEAVSYLEQLKEEGRYLKDVY